MACQIKLASASAVPFVRSQVVEKLGIAVPNGESAIVDTEIKVRLGFLLTNFCVCFLCCWTGRWLHDNVSEHLTQMLVA